LRSFERRLADFQGKGVAVVAISVDSNEESRKLAQSQGYTFPLLSDPGAKTIRAYRVLHPQGGEEGRDIARPAEFLVDSAGKVVWSHFSADLLARLRPEAVLAEIDRLR